MTNNELFDRALSLFDKDRLTYSALIEDLIKVETYSERPWQNVVSDINRVLYEHLQRTAGSSDYIPIRAIDSLMVPERKQFISYWLDDIRRHCLPALRR